MVEILDHAWSRGPRSIYSCPFIILQSANSLGLCKTLRKRSPYQRSPRSPGISASATATKEMFIAPPFLVSFSKARNNAFGMESRDAKRLYNAWSPNRTLTILTPNALIDRLSSLNGAANIDCDRLLPWIYNLPNMVEIFVSPIQSLDTPIYWQRHFFSGPDSDARFAKAIIFSVSSMICVRIDINGTSGVTKTNGILKSGHDNVGVDINFAQIYSKAWCCSLPQMIFP